MPNWVTNTVTISGSPEIVAEIAEELSQPYTTQYESFDKGEFVTKVVDIDQPFSFWNIEKPTNLEKYYARSMGDTMFDPENWYRWNVNHWGTKWDVNEVSVERKDNEISYGFDTAWAPPITALEKLYDKHPSIKMRVEWCEEQGFGEIVEYHNDEMKILDSWETTCWDCGVHDAKPETYNEEGEHDCSKGIG